jgi:hypothetical protein
MKGFILTLALVYSFLATALTPDHAYAKHHRRNASRGSSSCSNLLSDGFFDKPEYHAKNVPDYYLFYKFYSPTEAVAYPWNPDAQLTPGELCTDSDIFRYKEHIRYCPRKVSNERKYHIYEDYDKILGFHTLLMNRKDFKIDHFYPLCAGGSNSSANLWPQHKSVYEITDPVEQILCEKMADGLLTQKKAIELITLTKLHLEKAKEVFDYLKSL